MGASINHVDKVGGGGGFHQMSTFTKRSTKYSKNSQYLEEIEISLKGMVSLPTALKLLG